MFNIKLSLFKNFGRENQTAKPRGRGFGIRHMALGLGALIAAQALDMGSNAAHAQAGPAPTILTGGTPGYVAPGGPVLPGALPGGAPTDGGVLNGVGGTNNQCTAGPACDPKDGGPDYGALLFVPPLLPLLEGEMNAGSGERIEGTLTHNAGLDLGTQAETLDAAAIAGLRSDIMAEGRDTIDFGVSYATPVRDKTSDAAYVYPMTALGIAAFGPGGFFTTSTIDDLQHGFGTLTPNDWDAQMRQVPLSQGQVQVGADGQLYVGGVRVEGNMISGMVTPENGNIYLGIQHDNNNLESYIVVDAEADLFGNMNFDGRFADAGLWRGRDNLIERILNNATSLLLINQQTVDTDVMADTERLYQRAMRYTDRDGIERIALIIGARQTEANITSARMNLTMPYLPTGLTCDNLCEDTADVVIQRGNTHQVLRFDMERVDGNSRPAGTFTILGETEADDSVVFTYNREAYTFPAFRDSIVGPDGERLGDAISIRDLKRVYEGGIASATWRHDQTHDFIDSNNAAAVTMQPRLVPVDAAVVAAYTSPDEVGYDNARALFHAPDANDLVPTLRNVEIGGHGYTVQAEYGENGGFAQEIRFMLNGDLNAVDAPAQMASRYVLTGVDADGEPEYELVSGADVLANLEDCGDKAVIESFITTQLAPPPLRATGVGLDDTPSDPAPAATIDVSNIDVSVVEGCVTNIEGYNAQNSRVIKVEDGETTTYYLARFGTGVDGKIDSNVTLLAGTLNDAGHFVANDGATAISATTALGIDFDGAETNAQDRAEGIEIFKQAREVINTDIARCAEGCPAVEEPAAPAAPVAPNLLTIDADGDGRIRITTDGTLVDDDDAAVGTILRFDRAQYEGSPDLRGTESQETTASSGNNPLGNIDARLLYALGLMGVAGGAVGMGSMALRSIDAARRARRQKPIMNETGRKIATATTISGFGIMGVGAGAMVLSAVALPFTAAVATLAGGAAVGTGIGYLMHRFSSVAAAEHAEQKWLDDVEAKDRELQGEINKISNSNVKARAKELVEQGADAFDAENDKPVDKNTAAALIALAPQLWKRGKHGIGGRFLGNQSVLKNFGKDGITADQVSQDMQRPSMKATANKMLRRLKAATNG